MEEVHEKSPLLKSLSRSLKYSSDRELEPSVEITRPTMISYHNIEVAMPQRQIQLQGFGMPHFVTVYKPVLRGVSGIMKPGVNAIMGPSGAGKSTLLDILAKRRFPSSPYSHVLLDGHPLPKNYSIIAGYVVQDDILMGTLTVRESLQFSASLRLPSDMAKGDIELRVNELLHDLDLEHVADSRVGNQLDAEIGRGVSGGERKRTQIGMELVPFPKVLYLDEPTSGLDAFTAASVVRLLRRIADEGKIIILSIHQPRYSIFQDFDTVTLLGRGETVYHGRASEAKQYFQEIGCICQEHENPPDVFLDYIQEHTKLSAIGTQPEDVSLARRYKDSKQAVAVESELQNIGITTVKDKHVFDFSIDEYPSSFVTQLKTLNVRCLRNIFRLSSALGAQIILSLFLSLLIGTVYYQLDDDPKSAIQDRSGALFLSVVCIIFTNIPAVEMFILQRPLFMHETANGYYRVSTYFLAKVLCDVILIRLIPVFSFSVTTYWMIGLKEIVFVD
jgi:ATP-binding cassette subfamily G (WHITE) protein 2